MALNNNHGDPENSQEITSNGGFSVLRGIFSRTVIVLRAIPAAVINGFLSR